MSADMYQTMSLRTLSSEPSPSLRASLRFPERQTNRTDDIPGAKPFRVEQRWQAKPNTHSPADIERARPQALHPPKNQPTFVNRVDDIEGARPQKVHFSTGRSLDPLDPKYPLPSVKVDQPPPPRLLRPTPTNDDIRGSKPKSYKHIKSRPSMRVDDIEGAKAWSARARETRFRAQVDPLDVSDINSTGFKSQRVTDPLRPEHAIHGRVVRDDEGTFPRQTKTLQKPDPRYSTHDIEGAVPGWRPIWNLGGLTEAKRRPERVNPVDVADVPGAQANTAKRTVRTSRHLDPNAPDYVALDGKRLAAYTRPPTAERRAERLRRQEEELRRQWRAADARRGGATPTPTAGGPVDPSTLKDALAEAATSQRIEELEAEVAALRATQSAASRQRHQRAASTAASASATPSAARSARVSGAATPLSGAATPLSASRRGGTSGRDSRASARTTPQSRARSRQESARSAAEQAVVDLPDTVVPARSARSSRPASRVALQSAGAGVLA